MPAKVIVDGGYALDTVALSQADANAAAADYTVEDLLGLIDAAQEGRINVRTRGFGKATSTLS